MGVVIVDASLNSAVSALTSQSQALSTISNNLANTNTSGYKAVSTQFLSMLDTTTASTVSANAASGGVSTTGRQNVTLGGNITSTTTATDMAISGKGFFVVSNGSDTHLYYTRDGAFSTDSSGNLYLSGTNYYLMGWATDSSGSVSANESDPSSLQKINVANNSTTKATTTSYTLGANLPSDGQSSVNTLSYTNDSGSSESLNYSWVSTGANSSGNNTYLVTVTPSNSSVTLDDGTTSGSSALTYTVETNSSGSILNVTGTTQNTVGYTGTELPSTITASDQTSSSIDTSSMTWSSVKANSGYSTSSSMAIYDSNGTEEDVGVTWTAAGDNSWIMTVASPTTASGSTTSGSLTDASGVTASSNSYLVNFNSDGSLSSVSALSGMNANSISTAPTSANGSPEVSVYNWTDSASASTVTMTLGASGTSTGLTQYATGQSSPSIDVTTKSQDGYALGTLKSVSINKSGEVVGTYSNGQSIPMYKVALANFANADGLSAMSNNVYSQSSSSGSSILGEAGQNGTGSISGSSLESSTVDSSTQFSDMITCQQAYSAASQVITSTTQMFDSLMKGLG